MVEFQFQQFYLKEISIIQNNQLINLKTNLKDSIKMFQFKIIKLFFYYIIKVLIIYLIFILLFYY